MDKYISHIAGLFVIVIAVTVLLGWQFDISLLKSGFPFLPVTMKANTAICFLFAGISVVVLQRQRPARSYYRVSQGLAGAIIAIGLITLCEYFFSWDLHIDQLLFSDVVSSNTPYAGRMGISTAVNFVLMGIALFLIGRNRPKDTGLAQIFSTVAALVSLLALFEHLFNINIFERLTILTTTQALNTILSFFILHIGILWLRPNEGLMQVLTSPLVGGVMARWLLPWAIVLPVALNWFTFQGQKLGWYDFTFGDAISSTMMVFTFSILTCVTAQFLNQIDSKRRQTEKKLKELNETLEMLVAERTESLQKSQALFAGILEIANDAIISVDSNQHITLFNQGAEKIFGYKFEEAIGQPLHLLLPEQFRNAHNQYIQKFAQSSGKARSMGERGEILGRRQDGTEFPAEASISRLDIGSESVFTFILRDISDRKKTEEELGQTTILQKAILDSANYSIISTDLDGTILTFNTTAERWLGYSATEVVGKTTPVIIHDKEEVVRRSQELSAQMGISIEAGFEAFVAKARLGEVDEHEWSYIRKDGSRFPILLSLTALYDVKGDITGFLGIGNDITARREAQQTLELQSIIMNNMAGGVCLVKAADLTIGYTNPKFDAMFGYAEGELTGQPVGVINYVETEVTPDASVEDIVTQLDRDGAAKYEVYNKKKDGTLFWCRVHTSRFEHPEYGTVYVAVQEDISQLKLSEQALRTTTNRLNFLLNSSPVVIFSSKSDGDYGATFVSENIEEVMGYNPKVFLEESEFWINHLHPDDVDPVLNGLTNLFAEDFHFQEFRLLHADGNYRWILEQLKIIRDHAGNPIEILGYLIDISDRKQVELELQKAKEAAEAANLAKSMFLSNMSHELRTPLNAILGFTELMSYDPSLSPENQEDLAIVNRSGKHLLELINDVLDLSKIESGQMKLNPSDFALENLLISIEELFQVQAQSKDLKLIIDRDRNLPKFVHTDQKKLYQTLVNLLGNAIKFTKQGSVTLRVRQLEIPVLKQAHLLFEVEDTGVGIASKDIDSLFKAFVQAQAGNQLNQGTGLGLAISQRFIQLMGSQIRVQSTLNQGSTFSFELRVQLPQAAILTSEPLNQRVIGLASGKPTYRILIVEDLADNRRLLIEILTAIGFEVREATHGVEALSLWESWSPHLILMDLRMPIMDGYTATKRIREKPQSQDTVIIALTASVFDEDRDQVLMAGCNDFIGKPCQQKELFEKIAQHLGVQYIYETVGKPATQPSVETLSVEDLSAMPPQWLEQMYQAAYYLDTEVMKELIAQIPESKASLSKALTNSINNFNSDRIMELIRPLLPKLG